MQKTIAVAGGTGGLGAPICRELATRGYHLVVGYHSRREAAEQLATSIAEAGGSASVEPVNLCDEQQVQRFLAHAGSLGAGLAGVVNATGPAIPLRPLAEISSAEFRHIMTTDVEGAFNLLTAAGKLFAATGGGAILQLLTTAVLRTLENDAMSGIPKTAIMGIVRQLARELGPQNVRINGIAPGVIDAGIVHSSFTADPVAEAVIRDCLDKTPMPRMGRPEEVSALAAFLLSDQAGYINGQIIGIDGGYSA
ncbi:MAG: SDR family oxidoreductase [Haliea sp.]|uniref:SDR family NAD(P)-dependent oxidoreductase n=1 Tax=Haliea sp. TaxID=1932666 RepID=UPI0032EEB847